MLKLIILMEIVWRQTRKWPRKNGCARILFSLLTFCQCCPLQVKGRTSAQQFVPTPPHPLVIEKWKVQGSPDFAHNLLQIVSNNHVPPHTLKLTSGFVSSISRVKDELSHTFSVFYLIADQAHPVYEKRSPYVFRGKVSPHSQSSWQVRIDFWQERKNVYLTIIHLGNFFW